MTHTTAAQMAKQHGLELTFDPASDCDVLHPPGDTDAGVWLTLRQTTESEFEALCQKMSKKPTKTPPAGIAAQPVAKPEPAPAKEQAVTATTLYGKLLKFQSLPLSIHKANTASIGGRGSYRYADLPSCLEVIRPALAECGLVVVQLVDGDSLLTRIVDASTGEAIESRFHMPLEGLSWHQIGSAISYARRYALLSALSLAPDDDDDAHSTLPQPTATAAARMVAQPARPAEPAACPECGSGLEIGRKSGKLWCRSCWQAKQQANAY